MPIIPLTESPAFRACAVVNMDRRLDMDRRPVNKLANHPRHRHAAVLTGWHWADVVRACQDWLKPLS